MEVLMTCLRCKGLDQLLTDVSFQDLERAQVKKTLGDGARGDGLDSFLSALPDTDREWHLFGPSQQNNQCACNLMNIYYLQEPGEFSQERCLSALTNPTVPWGHLFSELSSHRQKPDKGTPFPTPPDQGRCRKVSSKASANSQLLAS